MRVNFREAHKLTKEIINETNDIEVTYKATFSLVCKALAKGWRNEYSITRGEYTLIIKSVEFGRVIGTIQKNGKGSRPFTGYSVNDDLFITKKGQFRLAEKNLFTDIFLRLRDRLTEIKKNTKPRYDYFTTTNSDTGGKVENKLLKEEHIFENGIEYIFKPKEEEEEKVELKSNMDWYTYQSVYCDENGKELD
jgi:hypothetical protein